MTEETRFQDVGQRHGYLQPGKCSGRNGVNFQAWPSEVNEALGGKCCRYPFIMSRALLPSQGRLSFLPCLDHAPHKAKLGHKHSKLEGPF
jgi:hypothetical protein